MLELSRQQILAHRRAAGALDRRLPAGPGSLLQAAHAGLQDSMPRAALLSLHARVEHVAHDVLDDPALIQLWGPRYSCYAVAATDRALFTLGRLPIDPRGRERAERIAAGVQRLIGAGVTDDRHIAAELGMHPNAIKYAAPTGILEIRWDGARAPDMWLVPPPEVDPEDARRELARRHLHVFGPATPETFSSWAGVTPAAAAVTYDALIADDELIGVDTPIGTRWILAADEASFAGTGADGRGQVRLLPSGDAFYLLQDADRELLIPDADERAQLWTSRVWPGGVLLDGEIRGTWRRAGTQLTVTAWGRFSAAQRQQVEAEAASLPLPGLTGPIRVTWEA